MARLRGISAAIPLIEDRLSGEPRRRKLVALAREAITAAEQQNRAAVGREVDYLTIVDGRQHAPIESVKVGGTVVALFAVHVAAIDFTWETLAQLSPVDENPKTIDDIVYRDNHLLLVNGEQRQGKTGSPVEIGVDDVVTFVNLLPYARRIEQGWSKKQAPDGVYEVTSEIVRAKFGNIVNVRFGYGSFLGAEATRETRYPFIELSPRRRR